MILRSYLVYQLQRSKTWGTGFARIFVVDMLLSFGRRRLSNVARLILRAITDEMQIIPIVFKQRGFVEKIRLDHAMMLCLPLGVVAMVPDACGRYGGESSAHLANSRVKSGGLCVGNLR